MWYVSVCEHVFGPCGSGYRVFSLWKCFMVGTCRIRGISGNVCKIRFPPGVLLLSPPLVLSLSLVLCSPLQARGSRQLPSNPESGIKRTAWQLVCYCFTGTDQSKTDKEQKRKIERSLGCGLHNFHSLVFFYELRRAQLHQEVARSNSAACGAGSLVTE